MQQVAASNKDLAAQGLFPGDPITSDTTDSGVNFAKVMETQNAETDDGSYRGHGDFFDSPGEGTRRQVSLEEGARKEAKIGDGFSDSHAKPEPEEGSVVREEQLNSGDGKAQDEHNNEAHEEWISIIQRLKSGEGFGGETFTPIVPVDDQGRNISSLPPSNPTDVQADATDDAVQLNTALSEAPLLNAGELLTEGELIQEEQGTDDVILTSTVSWKEELKQKLLNSGQSFNSNQINAIENDLSGMSDTDIQQLLNNDQALKQMLADVMSVQEQELDPQDVALLMALSGKDPGNLQNNPTDIDTVAVDGDLEQGIPLEGSGNSTESEAPNELEPPTESEASTDSEAPTESEASTESEAPNESEASTDSEAHEGPSDKPHELDSEQLIVEPGLQTQYAAQPEQIIDTSLQSESAGEEKLQQVTAATKPATDSVSDKPIKEVNPDLDKLLSELDSAVQSDKQKVATLENLTRRVESSELAQTPAAKTFVDTIKGATAEFKEQLKSGHEPGININKLVTEAVNAEAGKAEAVALEGHVKGAVQKMVDVAQTHLSLEPTTRENLISGFQGSLSNRENTLAQVEAGKAQQQNFQNQILDKAVNINKPEAAQDLANKVQVMMNQKNMVADIRLDPQDLGQMQIKIALQGDTASVSMVVQSQAAREALEHSEPRLKELLEQQGIELGQSSVQQESKGNKGDGSNFASGKGGDAVDELASDADQEQIVTMNEPDGIDYFA